MESQKEIVVAANNYFESIILMDNKSCPTTAGCDIFLVAGVIMPGKRLAGFGRNKCYRLEDMSGTLEAAPSTWLLMESNTSELSFKINTNIILDPGILASFLYFDITTESETTTHIPLNRPDIQINWQSRGTFVVTVNNI